MTCPRTSTVSRALATCSAMLAIAVTASTQCQLDWQPGAPKIGPTDKVTCVATLGNGDLVVAGWFEHVGTTTTNRVARWDGTQWHTLGTGVNDRVHAMTVMPNGDIVVGGEFTQAGGQPANRIARWDGATWSPIGAGFNSTVFELQALPNGNLFAGGTFTTTGTTTRNKVAIWDGTSWTSLGGGLFGTGVLCSEMMPNGDIVVGGPFGFSLTTGAVNLARWDGTSWSTFPFNTTHNVRALEVTPNGDLAISDMFSPTASVGIWDGTSLQLIPLDLSTDLHYAPNGDLFAANSIVQKWDGTTTTAIWNYDAEIEVLHTLPNGQLLVGGGFSTTRPMLCRPLQVWNGSAWQSLHAEPELRQSLATAPDGTLFSVVSNTVIATDNVVERWNGSAWQTVTTAFEGIVTDMTPDGAGGFFVIGDFTLPSQSPYPHVAHWDGATWTEAYLPAAGYPRDLFTGRDGTVYIASAQWHFSHVERFVAGHWQIVGTPLRNEIYAIAEMNNGDIIAGGHNILSMTGIESCARWDGTAWIDMGLVGAVKEIEHGNDDTLIVRGTDLLPGVPDSDLVMWNGSSWSVITTSAFDHIRSLVMLPNDDLIAAGSFVTIAGTPANNVARWDGSSWQALGLGADSAIYSVATTREGELFVTGDFLTAGGQPSAGTARAKTSCAAGVISFGSGCIGPAGPISIAATTLPWTGSDYRTRVYGMPGNSVGVHAIGMATGSIPLATLLPQSLPGCALLVSPALLELVVPSGNFAEATMRLPSNPAMIGATLHHQVLPVQFGPNGNITAIGASNSLSATVGFF